MTKQKLISLLTAVLLLQLMLAAVLYWFDSAEQNTQTGKKLLVLDANKIEKIQIEDGESSILLSRVNQQWLLPELDFPADSEKITRLIDKLVALKTGWPIATTGDAARRFKVSSDEFERKISLYQGDDPVVVFLGTSPNYRNIHIRADEQDSIYAVELSAYEAAVKQDDWIDKEILQQKLADIQKVTLDEHVLEKQDGVWTLPGLSDDEQPNSTEIQTLLNKIVNLRINGVLGKESKAEYRLDKPEHSLVMELVDNKQLVYQFSKPKDKSYFVLKSSQLEHYLRVPDYTLNPILEVTRDKLVQAKQAIAEDDASKNSGSDS